MDSEYDRKFEEMKKYIPFLENMIIRLESTNTSSSSNPRQAQLDKIRSLRDLLSNKKKRMKMENLLKCEQVLVNLYAKVEQRDTLSGAKKADSGFSIDTPTPKEKSDLEAVRNKLKTVAKRQESLQDTLPEILPRSEVDVHTSGTKEPALFQRRPNQQQSSTKTEADEKKTSPNSIAKRNYTRVLVSPESSARRWSTSESTAEKPLFSRRSPRKSPRRFSPAYNKKERKKSKDSRKQKDLNITLNVPEESLNSLNTKDIFSRIINCSDGDVDIDTLRELRKQILGELQKTGAKDDISDLILKSYNKKKKRKSKKREEVEEGELSDSESEAIESIYGSLVVKEPGQNKAATDKDNQPRKIQICLVINSDDNPDSNVKELAKKDANADFAELEMYEKDKKEETSTKENEKNKTEVANVNEETSVNDRQSATSPQKTLESQKIDNVTATPKEDSGKSLKENKSGSTKDSVIKALTENDAETVGTAPIEENKFKANFYKPLTEQSTLSNLEPTKNKDEECDTVIADSQNKTKQNETSDTSVNFMDIESTLQKMEKSTEIPLLHERTIEKKPPDSTLSEIDILQALKNEILSDITVPGTETATPLLHQPKVIKVASAQEILPKKRISIEKYKEKVVTSSTPQVNKACLKEDQTKKTSLKLTVKECERFNIPKISFDEESLEEDDDEILSNDIYGDLAPKSPDHDDTSSIESAPPVIIPVDPVKSLPVNHNADVDMRTLPLLSPNSVKTSAIFNNIVALPSNDPSVDKTKTENIQNRPLLVDPRVKRDLNPNISNQSPNPQVTLSERTPRHTFPGLLPTPTSNPIMTPNARTYEMTPTHQSFEVDQSKRSHVYVPTLSSWEREKSVPKEIRWDNTDSVCERRSRAEDLRESNWNPQIEKNKRYDPREDLYKRSDCSKTQSFSRSDAPVTSTPTYGRTETPMTPVPSFGRSECPPTPSHSFGRLDCPPTPSHPFGRMECPGTPSHPFGRSECPSTPNHSFGRGECPLTPSHPFGRSECPSTPSHPFGRNECPSTPSHPFGRNECPSTPSHPFGRIECPPTPSHPFGRIDCPPTPSHPFGRSDCPSTPSHPFGRNDGPPPLMRNMIDCPSKPTNSYVGGECPPTPTPLFGRNEGPPSGTQTQFGRSDPSKNLYSRSDPRLYRKEEERDRTYYKEQDRYRGSSYSSQSSFSGSENYRNSDRDHSSGRNSRYKYYAPDQRGRQYNRDQERCERSVGRSISKDHDGFHRDERRYSNDARSYEEVGSRREYQSEINAGRNSFRSQADGTRSFARASSIGKNCSRDSEHKMLSVKPNVGRSFTIDTSVNSTFQKYTHSAKEIHEHNTFDARRQRAASVGRSLIRESSMGRTQPLQVSKPKDKTETKREAFRRASSVGRDVHDNNKDKRSFQEIKADFKSYKFSSKDFCYENNESQNSSKSKLTTQYVGRSRKDIYDRQKDEQYGNECSKPSYKPKMNYRDPRMRKLLKNAKNDHLNESARKSGIVYSNDNIVTGSIMASGYGVKNYKIPKIKRATEEKEITPEKSDINKKDEKDKSKRKSNDNLKEPVKEKLIVKGQKGKGKRSDIVEVKDREACASPTQVNENPVKIVGKSDEHIEKRQTRSNKNSITESDIGVFVKTKKSKKVIYDSDIDDEIETKSNDVINESIDTGTNAEKLDTESEDADIKDKELNAPGGNVDAILDTNSTETINKTELKDTSTLIKDMKNTKLDSDISSISNFAIDELEMFADNIVSDPVIDNITDLIADLDNDLNTSKNETFTNEITLENMMQNISSLENFNDAEEDSSEILRAIDKHLEDEEKASLVDNFNQVEENVSLDVTEATGDKKPMVGSNTVKLDIDANNVKDPSGNIPTQSDAVNSKQNESSENISLKSLVKSNNEDIDSTTEIEKVKTQTDRPVFDEQSKDSCSTPDSTINTDDALQKSNNEDSMSGNTNEVTSTESMEPKSSTSAKEVTPALDTISLLSILQDKSKIKELLNMLGDQSSEKIKKKLEKLSEIVSDDEEGSDLPKDKTKQDDTVEMKSVIPENKNMDSNETEDEQLNKSNSTDFSDSNFKTEDHDNTSSHLEEDAQEIDTSANDAESKPKKKPVKKTKGMKKNKGKPKKVTSTAVKRVTRATVAETKPKVKKPPRELTMLQEDIKETMGDQMMSVTGIRMCRLVKLVDEKVSPPKEEPVISEVGPVVLLEKFSETADKIFDTEKVKKKKPGPKLKTKNLNDNDSETIKRDKTPGTIKHKPGPKSKTKNKKETDPYAFETDSIGDTHTEKASEDGSSCSSESESDSLASCKSFESTEPLSDIKKKTKRKRRGWQAGVIKPKTKKKKIEIKQPDRTPNEALEDSHEKVSIPDINCFTDRNYCFRKNLFSYSCRLCTFTGTDIVLHYRNQHPHVEIPLSRMTPEVAKEAIEQCEEINFKTVSKIPSDKYVCTFCFKEFSNSKSVLETFFWHIVSMHTGEYKQNCSSCTNVTECPFNLHIPAPPKDIKGQLIGYICQKCNFTQISLENLKTHVIVRHNDEQTAVYTINLSVMTKKALNSLLRRSLDADQLASQASLQSLDQVQPPNLEASEKDRDSIDRDSENEGVKTRNSARKSKPGVTPRIQSKITFEADDNVSEMSDVQSESGDTTIKLERIDSENVDVSNNEEGLATDVSEMDRSFDAEDLPNEEQVNAETEPSNDIVDCPHFKISHTESGTKEYYCCINGNYHFKTTLLISMKKHVQNKHSENWDGYCYVCKVIVTPQGVHRFIDCLQHYLDKHMDNFPIFEKELIETSSAQLPVVAKEIPTEILPVSKPKINVRPLSDLIPTTDVPQESAPFPVIQSVVSLGTPTVESPQPSPTYNAAAQEKDDERIYKYEEHQAEVISKKYYIVIQAMMTPVNLVKTFKCSGKYCLYATDLPKDALCHATTHQRIGGADALNCSYCDFDCAGNAVDLVAHVFRKHGNCQYCCEQCFYRAAASQTVGAHILRVHGTAPTPGSVLQSTNSLPINEMFRTNTAVMLTREEAVSYYVCGHSERDESCKFRTYTPDKFCEHLLQRHSNAQAHPCNLCSIEVPTATDLVQHMKTHGLKLYQCTWCVHGADNEGEMLMHMSIVHPDKQPQAYIRIITNKDGVARRVLPLAFLTKHKVLTKEVTITATIEHPVREAERSLEMEALIGPFINEPEATQTPTETTEIPLQTSEILEDIIESPTDVKPPQNILIPKPTEIPAEVQAPSTSEIVASKAVPNIEEIPVKEEPVDSVKKRGEIYDIVVLESDEDEPRPTILNPPPIIDLSDEEPSASPKKDNKEVKIIPDAILHTCPKCKVVCKNMGGFKKHTYSCVATLPELRCPHCANRVKNIDQLVYHFVADHTKKNTYECGHCNALLATENAARKHMKHVHKVIVSNMEINSDGTSRFIITEKKKPPEPPKERIVPKRKLSGPKVDATPPKRRYEPQEIDQLPINPILDHLVYCSRCEFSTKVRLNMVRHLQLHAEQQPVPQTAPVNPVPHLESNEKHFDKMVNLASSSTLNRTPDKIRPEHTPAVTLLIPPEAASRYPKYVPERQRLTCGAKGCSYISVDEAMLRRHWDALHSGTSDFRCVHCPPHQHLDTSKPLTATRIVSHLKMHDATLFACSSCSYYHFKREALEKHLSEVHKGGRLMVVREEYTAPISPPPVSNNAPTMDLKPWQCGLCKFKSMLRPEVAEHCFKFHQSKMQFKCAYCPFRTSAVENISKHQANSHAGKPEEVFFYYYREGSIPDEADGSPRWVKQRQKAGPFEPEVKVEVSVSPVPKTVTPPIAPPITVDLNLVKKEVNDPPVTTTGGVPSIEDLCKQFGQFCEPNGINYKCPLCSVVMEHTREGMQSHLYEELNYRKWSCGLCSYKAFHKAGLTDHMSSEHRKQYDHIELPTNGNIERWVTAILDHQTTIIDKRKENLLKQKIIVENNKPGPSNEVVVAKESVGKYSDKELETAFGSFGVPNCVMFCCPKCGFLCKDEVSMRDHLEMELNKIRWCCSTCPEQFQTYHEAQFHCKGHDVTSRPIEALREPTMRAAWVTTAIQKQKKIIQNIPTPSSENLTSDKTAPDTENSLLVVRYEERVPTPDLKNVRRKRSAPDSDDEKLTIEEPATKKKRDKHCPYCDFKSAYQSTIKTHMLTHFGLKPFRCAYCPFDSYTKKSIARHIELTHQDQPVKVHMNEVPVDALIKKPGETNLPNSICLVCEKPIPESEIDTHLHNNVKPQISKNSIVKKCCICLELCVDDKSLQEHQSTAHPGEPANYALYRLGVDTRETYLCLYCNTKFKYIRDYRAHHTVAHPTLRFNVKSSLYSTSTDIEPVVQKRCARKSTTKLPTAVARKSTTKLPYNVSDSSDESSDVEYSYYGTKPLPLHHYANVTTLMSFCNKMMPFSMKQLSEHLNIDPRVKVTDINKLQ